MGERYRILGQLGFGGFGVVYEAVHDPTGARVAVKMLRGAMIDDPQERALLTALFEREACLLSILDHPHIVRLRETGTRDDGSRYAVFDHVPGQTLEERIRRGGPMPAHEAFELMVQVLHGLCHAHDRGVVHRDLKPHNIMISNDEPAHATLLDFGVAALVPEAADDDRIPTVAAGDLRGTPAYMAPEQLRDVAPTRATDIYAWGLILLEMLTGLRAVRGRTNDDIVAKQLDSEPVPLPPELQAHPLGRIIARAVAKPLAWRFQTTRQVLEALDGLDVSALAQADLALAGDDEAAGPALTPDVRSGAALARRFGGATMHGSTRCATCGGANPGAAEACIHCGRCMGIECLYCRAVVPTGFRFCSGCGTAVGSADPPSDLSR